MNQPTNYVAGAAAVSPVWLPSLQEASDIAGLVLPIIGVTWLLIQIINHFWKIYKGRNK